jgi:hypothetical protein
LLQLNLALLDRGIPRVGFLLPPPHFVEEAVGVSHGSQRRTSPPDSTAQPDHELGKRTVNS